MTPAPHAVRIVVDGSKCDGRGICALVLPERIALDRWGYASIDDEPIEKARTLARAKRAVAACPAKALSLKGTTGVAPGRRAVADADLAVATDSPTTRRQDRPSVPRAI
jgi:ferredoxin